MSDALEEPQLLRPARRGVEGLGVLHSRVGVGGAADNEYGPAKAPQPIDGRNPAGQYVVAGPGLIAQQWLSQPRDWSSRNTSDAVVDRIAKVGINRLQHHRLYRQRTVI